MKGLQYFYCLSLNLIIGCLNCLAWWCCDQNSKYGSTCLHILFVSRLGSENLFTLVCLDCTQKQGNIAFFYPFCFLQTCKTLNSIYCHVLHQQVSVNFFEMRILSPIGYYISLHLCGAVLDYNKRNIYMLMAMASGFTFLADHELSWLLFCSGFRFILNWKQGIP